jgi:hypothetical protein
MNQHKQEIYTYIYINTMGVPPKPVTDVTDANIRSKTVNAVQIQRKHGYMSHVTGCN